MVPRVLVGGSAYSSGDISELIWLVNAGIIKKIGVPQIFATDSNNMIIRPSTADKYIQDHQLTLASLKSKSDLAPPADTPLSQEDELSFRKRFSAITILQVDKYYTMTF